MERKSRTLVRELLKRTPLLVLSIVGAMEMAKFTEGRAEAAGPTDCEDCRLVFTRFDPSPTDRTSDKCISWEGKYPDVHQIGFASCEDDEEMFASVKCEENPDFMGQWPDQPYHCETTVLCCPGENVLYNDQNPEKKQGVTVSICGERGERLRLSSSDRKQPFGESFETGLNGCIDLFGVNPKEGFRIKSLDRDLFSETIDGSQGYWHVDFKAISRRESLERIARWATKLVGLSN